MECSKNVAPQIANSATLVVNRLKDIRIVTFLFVGLEFSAFTSGSRAKWAVL